MEMDQVVDEHPIEEAEPGAKISDYEGLSIEEGFAMARRVLGPNQEPWNKWSRSHEVSRVVRILVEDTAGMAYRHGEAERMDAHFKATDPRRANYQHLMSYYQAITGQPKHEPGWVYFVIAESGLVKIGKAGEVTERVKSIGLVVPFEIRILHAIRTDCAGYLEREYHLRFARHRVKGEWFRLEFLDVAMAMQIEEQFFLHDEWQSEAHQTLGWLADEWERSVAIRGEFE